MIKPQNRKYKIGETFINKKGFEYQIIKYLPQGKYLVEFKKSKYQSSCSAAVIRKAEIMDRLAPTCSGVGYIGLIYNSTHPLYNTWLAMLSRCYDISDKDYPRYGGVGISVSQDWHNFSTYAQDIMKKDNYSKWLSERNLWHLDKDIYSIEKIYSNENVFIIPAKENNGKIKASERKYPYGIYKTTTPNGSTRIIAQYNKKSKSFNINKYGEELALKLAIEALELLKE